VVAQLLRSARTPHYLLADKYRGDDDAIVELNAARDEIELFRRFYDSYGYVFYAMERV
jgi:hypothetical protein